MTHRITRRQAALGLTTLGVIATGRPRDARADLAALEADARKEATLTWYIAQVDAETAEALARAFTKDHPGITVSVIRTTGQVAYQRLTMDIKNHAPQCDVFSTTDISHMPILKEKHELTEYVPENAAFIAPAFLPLTDPGYSYISNAARHFLIYNKNQLTPEQAPKAWTDMLDPRFKGRVATGHPAFSGCTGVWAVAVRKIHGWGFFEQLAKNNPRIGRSGVDPVTLMSAGEVQVGVGPANVSYMMADKGNPIGIQVPTDGMALCVTPSGIPANAPHPAAARLFMEWLLSEHYSQLIAADGSETVRAGVPTRAGMPALASQKVIPLTIEEIRKGVPEVIEAWRDTFGN
jgi:iron(III) transport system substrate-binding protein